jgi:myo-inositol-1(or 4)-monophosphatase
MGTLEQAIIYAVQKHSGSVRKGTRIPYIVHPLEAVAIAAGMTDDSEVLAAAVLHDVVEDTPVTIDELESVFGRRVAALVYSDSEDKLPEIPASESWIIRKQSTLTALKSYTYDEKIIVLADKLSNIRAIYRDITAIGDLIWNRFNQKDKRMHEWYYRGIKEALSDLSQHEAYKELIYLISMVFGDK